MLHEMFDKVLNTFLKPRILAHFRTDCSLRNQRKVGNFCFIYSFHALSKVFFDFKKSNMKSKASASFTFVAHSKGIFFKEVDLEIVRLQFILRMLFLNFVMLMTSGLNKISFSEKIEVQNPFTRYETLERTSLNILKQLKHHSTTY